MRTFLYGATALAIGGLVAGGPAFAATPNTTGNAVGTPAKVNAAGNTTAEAQSAQQLVSDLLQTVNKIKADGRFADMLKHAKGVFIMPTLVTGAFVVGGEGAQGVLLKHDSNGGWSDPAFLTMGSISIGAQAGGKAGPAAMILMTDKALNDFTQANNFSVNGNAGLTVIGYSAAGQAPVGKGDIVLWSDQSGLFAGVNVSGADLTQNTAQNAAYYGKQVDAQQILAGSVANPGAAKLKSALPS